MIGGAARRALAPMALALGLAIAATGCVTTRNTFPPLGSTPGPPGEATTALVARVIGALRDQGLAADVSARPFRPVEGPLLAAAARTVIEVALPDAPSNAWVVVYEVASVAAATAAAQDHAAYVAAGIGGGVLYPPGTQFVLQVVDTDVIFFTWLPAGAVDGRTAMIAQALRSIGSPVDVPR